MQFRITPEPGGSQRLRVDGRLTVAGVPELEQACQTAGRPLGLVLAGLQSADAEGIAALRALETKGVELHDANPYLLLLLGAPFGPDDKHSG